MTADRPTTEPRPSDEKVRAALVEVGKAEQWGQVAKGTLSTLHAAFRAEPAPPLDVFDNLLRHHNATCPNGWRCEFAKQAAARLGSAPSNRKEVNHD